MKFNRSVVSKLSDPSRVANVFFNFLILFIFIFIFQGSFNITNGCKDIRRTFPNSFRCRRQISYKISRRRQKWFVWFARSCLLVLRDNTPISNRSHFLRISSMIICSAAWVREILAMTMKVKRLDSGRVATLPISSRAAPCSTFLMRDNLRRFQLSTPTAL